MTPPNATSPFVGFFDTCEDGIARGWAFDQLSPNSVVRLHVLIDNQEVAQILCDAERSDVANVFGLARPYVGFEFHIPDEFIDGAEHTIAFRFSDRSAVPFSGARAADDHKDVHTFLGYIQPTYQGYADGIKQGILRGWVVQSHRDGPKKGGVTVCVTANGTNLAQLKADRYRGDVAAVLGCDPNCGFEYVIPQRLRGSMPREYRVVVMPEKIELDGSPFVTSIANDQLETRLVDIADTIDALQKELTRLRTEIRNVIPQPGFNLGDYDNWARRYYADLRSRVAQAREQTPLKTQPLVSVLVPTYKPLMSDFEAAIESVIGQTYPHWELIIVDDGAKSAEIAKRIDLYCKQDSRIRAITLKKNQGIAGATNAGMDAAQGDYTVFFDHDDLMVDVALEVMVRAAERTGARLLYSDEDKIDQAGYFSAPNFKPDFNHRYLLGCNYICHLTMVETKTMRQIGLLRKEYDGAQDHDFVLRASEILKEDEIYHVPELLYHWRLTPNSTAVRIDNKQYAVQAGVKAVHDHLIRLKLKADVSSINELSIYNVQWKPTRKPKVSIIIPFKDQIEMTQRCVEAILEHTDYRNYEIVLVDNWSVTLESVRFTKTFSKRRNVRFVRIEEPFNYSRINNLAVATCDKSEFYMFMNNDVFVENGSWLSELIGEALAEPNVGAVGAKLLYPDDTIQHAGVAVGPAGVATHIHRAINRYDYGYIGRARLSHEVTAVTAAAMLVRADVFKKIGGFDELDLQVAYNDVDLCLKIRAAGYKIIFAANAIAYHHESISRGSDQTPEHEGRFLRETQTMQDRWGKQAIFIRDPAYSRFFATDHQPFFELVDPRRLADYPI
ncbi:glycosyltransferase family 2 protein [Kozakia baliensis]|uniref:glycosyltransferase family 2 protein n=1 Tax=Kozakia baliensis TaxID=153496 RepID=UPI0004986A72|nr:glycosyltransferase family 2 protein [Kozakia baliensis]